MRSLLSRASYQTALSVALWMLLYYLANVVSLRIDESVTIIFFPDGVTMTAFLRVRPKYWPALCIGFVLADLAAYTVAPHHWAAYAAETAIDILKTMLIAFCVRRFARHGDGLHVLLLWIFSTLVVCLVAVFATAVCADLLTSDTSLWEVFWLDYFGTVAGIYFITVTITGFLRSQIPYPFRVTPQFVAGVGIVLLMSALAYVIFSGAGKDIGEALFGSRWKVLNLGATTVLIAMAIVLSIILGNWGGSTALLILASFVLYHTHEKTGPFFIAGFRHGEPLLIAQIYLTITALLMLSVRVVRKALATNHHVDDEEIPSIQVFYQLDTLTNEIHWDHIPEAFLDTATQLHNAKHLLARVHPGDGSALRRHWQARAVAALRPTTFRLRATDGSWMNIHASGQVLSHTADQSIIVGCWQIEQLPTDSPSPLRMTPT